MVLVLTVAAQDADRDAVVLALREAGVATTVVSRDGAGHTFTCGLAFDTLSAAHGGVFLIDRGCRLRLAFAATQPGEWIPASMVLSRLRRLAAA